MVQSDQCPPCLWIYLSVSQNCIIDKHKNDLLSAQLDRKDQRVTFSPVAKGISFSADSCDKKKKTAKERTCIHKLTLSVWGFMNTAHGPTSSVAASPTLSWDGYFSPFPLISQTTCPLCQKYVLYCPQRSFHCPLNEDTLQHLALWAVLCLSCVSFPDVWASVGVIASLFTWLCLCLLCGFL